MSLRFGRFVAGAVVAGAATRGYGMGRTLRIDALQGFEGASLVMPQGISDNGYVSGLIQGAGSTQQLHNVLWRGTAVSFEDSVDCSVDGAISAVNNSGQAFVTGPGKDGSSAAYLWTRTGVTPLASTQNSAYPVAINNQGVVVGVDVSPADGTTTGVVWRAGVYSVLSSPDGYSGAPAAINDDGMVVGSYGKVTFDDDGMPSSESTAVAWGSDGTLHVLATPDGNVGQGHAAAISGNGTILGSIYVPSDNPALPGTTSFLRWASADASPTVIAVPQGTGTVSGISDAGQSFGNFSIDGGISASTPFVFDVHGYQPLEDLLTNGNGWTDMTITAMNNSGDMVGYGELNGETRGFLVSSTVPVVPEPGVLAVIAGTGVLALRRRGRSGGR